MVISQVLDPILCQMNLVNALPCYFFILHLIVFHQCRGFANILFALGFPTKTVYIPFPLLMLYDPPSHPPFLDHLNNIW